MKKENFQNLVVITSDWHLHRAKIIFNLTMVKIITKFLDAKTLTHQLRLKRKKIL